jgi:hypothetical protein
MTQDSALSRALARQETLRREIEERQEEVRKIEIFVSLYPQFADDDPPNRAQASSETAPETGVDENRSAGGDTQQSGKRSGLTQPEFERISRELLLARGRPAQRQAFLDLFRERHIVVGGVDELKNLGTKIWNARAVLTNIRGEGYWPTDVPCPAVGYIPAQGPSDNGQQEFADMHSAA